MSLKKDDLVQIEYTASIKRTGEIFDTTNPDLGQKIGLRELVKPRIIIIGAQMIIEGLERELLKHKVGEEFTVSLDSNQAFGERQKELVKVFNKNLLIKQNINPYPGLMVEIENMKAKVLSVSGGRVRLDFNHPLSGKQVEYAVKINKKIEDKTEYIKTILEQRIGIIDAKITLTTTKATIKTKQELPEQIIKILSEEIKKYTKLESIFNPKKEEKK